MSACARAPGRLLSFTRRASPYELPPLLEVSRRLVQQMLRVRVEDAARNLQSCLHLGSVFIELHFLCSFSLSHCAAEIWLSKHCQRSMRTSPCVLQLWGRIPIPCKSAWPFVRSPAPGSCALPRPAWLSDRKVVRSFPGHLHDCVDLISKVLHVGMPSPAFSRRASPL